MRFLTLHALLVLSAVAQSATPPPAPATLQNLMANSPFGSAAQPGAAPVAATPLEFRGTFVDNGERFFSILDTSSRRAEWVSLNESGRPFTVKSYDAEKESIAVDFQGRSLELKLHSARIAVAAPAPAPAVAAQPAGGGGGGAQARPATPAPSASEAQRLAQVAEEIRRRRALRQQAAGGPPPNTAPPPNSTPAQPRSN
jgi:hypothetical protein